MKDSNNRNPKEVKNHNVGNNGPSRSVLALEVGRILITYPRYGRMDVYLKRNKDVGATFICEENGGCYGVTQGIRKHFPNPGSYTGWGYINSRQTVVFKFLLGDSSNVPESLVAIETSEGRVDFAASTKDKAKYPDGAIVAFYARLVKRNPASPPKRKATDIFPVDADHLPLAAGLISAGRLTFPEHIEVLQLFLDSLPGIRNLDQQNLKLFDSALTWLATNSGVPAQFQQLARVERSRIASAGMEQVNVPLLQHRGTITEERKNTKIKPTSQIPAKSTVVGDVVQVKLQLD